MIRIRKSVLVAKPLAEVFAFVSDITKEPLWRKAVTSVFHAGGPERGVGARYRLSGSYEGRSGDALLACSEWVDNECVSWVGGEGPVGASFTYETRADGEGTRVVMVAKADLKGAARLLAGTAEKIIGKMAEDDLRALKRVIERGETEAE